MFRSIAKTDSLRAKVRLESTWKNNESRVQTNSHLHSIRMPALRRALRRNACPRRRGQHISPLVPRNKHSSTASTWRRPFVIWRDVCSRRRVLSGGIGIGNIQRGAGSGSGGTLLTGATLLLTEPHFLSSADVNKGLAPYKPCANTESFTPAIRSISWIVLSYFPDKKSIPRLVGGKSSLRSRRSPVRTWFRPKVTQRTSLHSLQ